MVHVPYKGGGPAITALDAGDVQVMLMSPPPSLQLVKSGKLRALAYTHSKRAGFLPEVPTMTEAGLPGLEIDGGWYGNIADQGYVLIEGAQSNVAFFPLYPMSVRALDTILPGGDIVLIIDRSGSMSGDPLKDSFLKDWVYAMTSDAMGTWAIPP